MKNLIFLILGIIILSCNPKVQHIYFYNSTVANYSYEVQDRDKNKYYTNDIKQITSTCIKFVAQDSTEKIVCDNYSITIINKFYVRSD